MRFLGNIEVRIDSKGRIFMPAPFRKELQAAGQERIVVRKDLHEQCLVVYPESTWAEHIGMLFGDVPVWDATAKQVRRQYVSEAEVVALDASGRFLISRKLQEAAGLGQAVTFIGTNETIEIWAAEKTEQPFLSQEELARQLKTMMMSKGQ